MSRLPIYLIARAGAFRDSCLAALGGDVELLDAPSLEEALSERPAGIVLWHADDATVDRLAGLARSLEGPAWTLAILEEGPPPALRAVSIGKPEALESVAAYAAEPGSHAGVLLHLEGVLAEISTARHDINNPLTSALAETQMLLMDAGDGEERVSLLAIQEQLRRIRDLLAATRHLRLNR